MRNLIYISLFCLLGFAKVANSQQQYVYTNYLLNDYYFNPALAGSEDIHRASLSYRNQWVGFDEAPTTVHGNIYGSYKNLMKHGYGLSIVSDRTGLVTNTGFYVNYAYHLDVTEDIRLGFGIRPGFMQNRVDLFDARIADLGDEILTGNVFAANAFDMSSGLHMYSNKFFATISMQHMLGDAISFTSYNQSLVPHFNIIGGYTFELEKQQLDIEPSIMLKHVRPVPAQLATMVRVTYHKKFWGGLTFRTGDGAGLALGAIIKDKLNIGYAYDYAIGGIRPYQGGSHELMISFVVTDKKPSLDEEDEQLNQGIFEQNKKRMKE